MFDRNAALLFRDQEVLGHLESLPLGGLVFDKDIVKAVRKCLRPLQVKVKYNYSDVADYEQTIVSSYFDPNAEDDNLYEVWLTFRSKGQFSHFHKHVYQLKCDIADSLVHEYVHYLQYQSGAGNKDSDSDKDYLAEDDEIDAYAISIAIELCRTLGKYRALRYMGRLSALAKLRIQGSFVSPNLSAYFGQFEGSDHQIMKRLAKKVYVRLQKIDTDVIFM